MMLNLKKSFFVISAARKRLFNNFYRQLENLCTPFVGKKRIKKSLKGN